MIKIGPVYIVTICRVLLERLIVNRPHPWGLLITFIELIKNPTFKFWTHEFVHCAPEIQKLFESVARSCMVASQPRQETPGRVRKSWISASLGKPSFVKLKIYVPVFLFRCLYLFFLVYFLIKKRGFWSVASLINIFLSFSGDWYPDFQIENVATPVLPAE